MTDSTSRKRIDLKRWFDELIDLAPDAREARIDAAGLGSDDADQLRAMIAFDDLAQLAPSERVEHLARHDAPSSVRQRVERMLAKDDSTPSVLRDTAEEALRSLRDEGGSGLAESMVGRSIGSFRLLEILGEGGSAVVFRAERDVGSGTQTVALKLLRTGLFSEGEQRRFRREQAILAQFAHPRIAQLIDGGVSEAGVPYIAMELVDGLPITQAADQRKLGLRERLVWFAQLRRTMATAHAALVIHRDLKPSNILVTRAGDLKVLDFGIAKLIESDDEGTRSIALAFTPAYAAPEQFHPGRLTTAVDIYALGIILGELLTGERPEAGARLSVLAGRTTQDPMSGSRAGRRQLARQLSGDLDAIATTATAFEAHRRYASCEALADDIDRYLAGTPVLAHPPSSWYAFRKFVGRHRVAVSVALAFLGVIAGALFVLHREARVAESEAARARTVRDLVVSVFNAAGADLPKDRRPSVQDIVEEASSQLSRRDDLPVDVQVDLLMTLANVARSVGAYDRALALVDRAARFPTDADGHLQLSVLRADILRAQGHDREAIAVLDQLKPQLLDATTPASVSGLSSLGAALSMAKQRDAGLPLLAKAVEIAEAHHDQMPETLLQARITQASMLIDAEKYRDGVASAEDAFALWHQLADPARQDVIKLYGAVALADEAIGDVPRAERAYRDAIAYGDRFFDGPNAATAWNVGVYGTFLVAQGRLDEAEPLLRRALDQRKKVFGDSDARTLNAVAGMGKLYVARKDYERAALWYSEGIDACAANALKETICPRLLAFRARALARTREFDKAETDMQDALGQQAAITGEGSREYAAILENLVVIQVLHGAYEKALDTAQRVLDLDKANNAGMLQSELTTRYYRALALFQLKRNDEALVELLDVEPAYARIAPHGVSRFDMTALTARALSRAARRAEAKDYAQRALQIDPSGADHDPAVMKELDELANGSVQ